MPEISIVLPTYNGEKFIRESIESILCQTFSDWELIIVNDCSTDSTPRILEEYERNDKRIKVIHNAVNQKLPRSLNIGFSFATGKYLTWTSDDNIYELNALLFMWNFLENDSTYPMVVADMMLIDQDSGESYIQSYDPVKIFIHNCVGACFLYRYEILKTVGSYDLERFLVEDYDYWLRVLFYYGRIGHISDVLYKYRLSKYSLTSLRSYDVRRQKAKLLFDYFDKVIDQIKSHQAWIFDLCLELRNSEILTDEKLGEIYGYIPVLKFEKKFDNKKKYIIFGAGFWGKVAKKNLCERAKYFVDSNVKKTGQLIEGLQVLSITQMMDKRKDYHILLAVGGEYILDLIEIMEDLHIKKFSIYCGADMILDSKYLYCKERI